MTYHEWYQEYRAVLNKLNPDGECYKMITKHRDARVRRGAYWADRFHKLVCSKEPVLKMLDEHGSNDEICRQLSGGFK